MRLIRNRFREEASQRPQDPYYAIAWGRILTDVNLVVGTTNNNAPIAMSIKKAAEGLIKNGNVNEGLLNQVEMAFRNYDPCMSCATHSLPGQMPLEIQIRNADGELIETRSQYIDQA